MFNAGLAYIELADDEVGPMGSDVVYSRGHYTFFEAEDVAMDHGKYVNPASMCNKDHSYTHFYCSICILFWSQICCYLEASGWGVAGTHRHLQQQHSAFSLIAWLEC